jgi:shikimate 5-dehydrogenase
MESRKRDDHQEDGGLGRDRVTVVNRHVESAEKLDRVLARNRKSVYWVSLHACEI